MHDAGHTTRKSADIRQFLALAFPLSWALWIPVILRQANPVFLNLGGGPAIAAMWLSMCDHRSRANAARMIAFGVALPICWLVVVWNIAADSPSLPLRFYPWLLVPSAISAWIISGAFSRDPGLRALLRTPVAESNWRWCLVSLLLLPALILASVAIAGVLRFPIVQPLAGASARSATALIAVRFLHEVFFTAIFEEPGWRGFLLARLQLRFSPLMATVLVWLPWALWHLPLDLTRPGWNLLTIFLLRGPALLAASILITWLYNRSRGSLLAPVLFHASMNSFPFLLPASSLLLPLVLILTLAVIIGDRMWTTGYAAR